MLDMFGYGSIAFTRLVHSGKGLLGYSWILDIGESVGLVGSIVLPRYYWILAIGYLDIGFWILDTHIHTHTYTYT